MYGDAVFEQVANIGFLCCNRDDNRYLVVKLTKWCAGQNVSEQWVDYDILIAANNAINLRRAEIFFESLRRFQ